MTFVNHLERENPEWRPWREISKKQLCLANLKKVVRFQLANMQGIIHNISHRVPKQITQGRQNTKSCKPLKTKACSSYFWHPLRESNSQLILRRDLLSPFN